MTLSKKDKEEIAAMIAAAIQGGEQEDRSLGSNESRNNYSEEWQSKGIKSKLTGLTVAPVDLAVYLPYGTTKTHFTYDEALAAAENLPDGWRLPTRSEWVLLAEEFGNNPETGELDSVKLRDALKLGLNGYEQDSLQNGLGSYGYFWSSTRIDSYSMYYLYVDASNVYPAGDYVRNAGLSMRCVAQFSDAAKEEE